MEKLLVGEKVEWKKLGEVCEIGTGKSNTNEQSDNGKYPFYVRSKDIKRINKFEFDETSIIIPGEGGIGEIFHYVKGKYALHQRAYRIHIIDGKIITKFIYYYLMNNFKKYIMKNAVSSTITSIRKPMIENFEIPIPQIEIQKEIVKILDNFTKCVTELQEKLQIELNSRIKHYNYYRDMLLSEDYLNKISEKLDSLNNENYVLRLTTLGEIGKFTRGNGLQKKDFRKKGKPVIHYGQIYTQYGFSTENTISFTEEDVFSKLRKAKPNDVLIATTSENIEDVAKSTVWLGNEEIGFSGDMYSYSTNENSKYIAYYFQTAEFQKQKERKVTGTKLIRIHGSDMEKFKISLPPIEIQNKIVKILDRFHELLSDTKGLLPLEIKQRRKQYEYYREKLLTFDSICARTNERTNITKQYLRLIDEAAEVAGIDVSDKVEWKTLGEICNIKTGKKPKEEIYETNKIAKYKYINAGTTETGYIFSFNHEKDTVTTPSRGQGGIGFVGFQSEKFWLGALCYGIKSKDEKILMNKYLYYYLLNSNQIILLKKEAGVPAINLNELSKIKVILPPLPVQEYIVSILDKFDALVNDLSQGLPKEIELRQKQYEYYREKLLDFEK